MRRLADLETQILAAPDQQVSLTETPTRAQRRRAVAARGRASLLHSHEVRGPYEYYLVCPEASSDRPQIRGFRQ